MKEHLFQIKKKLLAFSKRQLRNMSRLFVKTKLSEEESFQVPIVLNNRNRYTYLKDLVGWLQKAGYKNIFILDNDSEYPELLQYYKKTTAKVIYLRRNVGYKALWESEFFNVIRKGYYVYSDSDLMPNEKSPANLVYRLYQVLSKYTTEKCGPALMISDLPEHYALKQKVLANEKPFWEKTKEENVFEAPLDTTFALYKPFAFGDAEECSALRVGGDLILIHRPWYENSANLDEETKYYISKASASSFWYNKVKVIP